MSITMERDERGYFNFIIINDDDSVERYDEDSVPHSIIRLVNWNRPAYEGENISTWYFPTITKKQIVH